MTEFGFPYRIAPDGRTAGADRERHVRDLIEQVLFTAPGERVNRPEFGAGIRQLVFAQNAPELATAAQHMVQSALQRFLADALEVRGIDVQARDSTLLVAVRFRLLDESQERVVRLRGRV